MTSPVGAGTAYLSSGLLHFLSKSKENFPKNRKKAIRGFKYSDVFLYIFYFKKIYIFILYSIFRMPDCNKVFIQLIRD